MQNKAEIGLWPGRIHFMLCILCAAICWMYSGTKALSVLALVWTAAAGIIFIPKSRWHPEWFFPGIIFSSIWLIWEISFVILFPLAKIQDYAWIVNGEYVPDPNAGFILRGKDIRLGRIVRNMPAYDNAAFPLNPNAQGFPDTDNFELHSAQDSNTILWMGDSFSAGLYLEKNLPQRCEEIFSRKKNGIRILNYSIDGGGLKNWHSLYLKKARYVPHQKLVLAVFRDNLHRDFATAMSDAQHVLFTRLKTIPQNLPEWLAAHTSELKPILNRITHQQADSLRALADLQIYERVLPQKLQTEKFLIHILNLLKSGKTDQLTPDIEKDIQEIQMACQAEGSELILLAVPDPELYAQYGEDNIHSRNMKFLAEKYAARFINGYEMYSGFSPWVIQALYLKNDRHWNQQGSDYFAGWVRDKL